MSPLKAFMIFMFCYLNISDIVCTNKYSEELNDPNNIKYKRPFRMSKINLIWEKAHKVGAP